MMRIVQKMTVIYLVIGLCLISKIATGMLTFGFEDLLTDEGVYELTTGSLIVDTNCPALWYLDNSTIYETSTEALTTPNTTEEATEYITEYHNSTGDGTNGSTSFSWSTTDVDSTLVNSYETPTAPSTTLSPPSSSPQPSSSCSNPNRFEEQYGGRFIGNLTGAFERIYFTDGNGRTWNYSTAVFSINGSLKLSGEVKVEVIGYNSLRLESLNGNISIDVPINISGQHGGNNTDNYAGGFGDENGGPGAGGATGNPNTTDGGPGGGGFGGNGGGTFVYIDSDRTFIYGAEYYSLTDDLIGGSAGAKWDESTVSRLRGGGAMELKAADTIYINSSLRADGQSGSEEHERKDCVGGGSGGMLILNAPSIVLGENSFLNVTGGAGSFKSDGGPNKTYCAGGGAGGVIQFFDLNLEVDVVEESHTLVLGGEGHQSGENGDVKYHVYGSGSGGSGNGPPPGQVATNRVDESSPTTLESLASEPTTETPTPVKTGTPSTPINYSEGFENTSVPDYQVATNSVDDSMPTTFRNDSEGFGNTSVPDYQVATNSVDDSMPTTFINDSEGGDSRPPTDEAQISESDPLPQPTGKEKIEESAGEIKDKITEKPHSDLRDKDKRETFVKDVVDDFDQIVNETDMGSSEDMSTLVFEVEDTVSLLAKTLQEAKDDNETLTVTASSNAFDVIISIEDALMYEGSKHQVNQQISVYIPRTIIADSFTDDIVISHVFYNDLGGNLDRSLDTAGENETYEVNGCMLSTTIQLDNETQLVFVSSIEIVFEHINQDATEETTQCVYWKYNDTYSTGGVWSTDGCTKGEVNQTHTTCQCVHLTSFCVLLHVTDIQVDEAHSTALNIITYVGLSLSLVTLIITFIIMVIYFKRLNYECTSIHINLVTALIIADTLFLFGVDQTSNKDICTGIAIFMHYFYLVVFMWMAVEAIHMHNKVRSLNQSPRRNFYVYYPIGWGIPAIIVIITMMVSVDGYGTDTACWLAIDSGTIWAFVGPVIAIVSLNALFMGIVLKTFSDVKSIKSKPKKEQIRRTLRAAVILLPIFGVTWVFGVLAFNEQTLFFQYMFAIFNSLQGFFIFLFHCCLNVEIKGIICSRFRKSVDDNSVNQTRSGGARRTQVTPFSTR